MMSKFRLVFLVLLTPVSASAATQVSGGSTTPSSLGSFISLAAAMGALSLLTPCVFPMIPITVSYFTNHSAGSRREAVRHALIYAAGIVLTFTALGMALALLVGAAGINKFAANPWVNLLITGIFLGFALNLFGAYLIQIPPGLVNKLDAVIRREGGSQMLGTLLMGFTFTLTSFTCTAAFVGTLLVMASQGSWRWPLLGMFVFSTVFALPFFLLALAPQLLAQLPKSGGWLNSVKVVMGFLEIAAAMKFISNVDLVWRWGVFTREVCLAVWVAIGILIVFYLLGWFKFEHDSPLEHVGPLRLASALVFFSITLWMLTGLFSRQLGELESFLPPPLAVATNNGSGPTIKSGSASSGQAESTELSFILNDYAEALREAKAENKAVFVDFTGYTCTNCRWMEANMFPRPEISRELKKFVRVQLYTDGEGELYERQQKMQQDRFGTVALPYYAIVASNGVSSRTFSGLTRNSAEFLSFLQ